MIATPEEARKLWCPMVRIVRHVDVYREIPSVGGSHPLATDEIKETHVVGGCNTTSRRQVLPHFRCIADQCAMWRWVPKTGIRPEVIDDPRLGPGGKRVIHRDGPIAPTHGFCGLAGRPEVAP